MAFKGEKTAKRQIYCSEYAYIRKNNPLLCEIIIPSGGRFEADVLVFDLLPRSQISFDQAFYETILRQCHFIIIITALYEFYHMFFHHRTIAENGSPKCTVLPLHRT